MAIVNVMLGSTKYYDWESGYYYYGLRYYGPSFGGWPNRDSISELGGMNLYAFTDNNPIWAFDYLGMLPEWHHDFPQAIFTPELLQALGITSNEIDINSKEYGHMLNFKQHRGAVDSVHSQKWNDEWKKWLENESKGGTPITADRLKKQLGVMKNSDNCKKFYELGVAAKYDYKGWKRVEDKIKREVNEKIEKLIAKRAAKIGSKRVPIIGIATTVFFFVGDCEADGFWVATRDGIVGNIPYVGTAYGVYQIADVYASKDEMVDEEMTARVYTGDY
jgi:RHS repeat-associated protein